MHPAYLLLHNPPIAPKGLPIYGQWVGPNGRDLLRTTKLTVPLKVSDEYEINAVVTAYPELTSNNMGKNWQLPHMVLRNLLSTSLLTGKMSEFTDKWQLACQLAEIDRNATATVLVMVNGHQWAEFSITGFGGWQIRPFNGTVLYQNGRFLTKEGLLEQIMRHHANERARVEKLFTTNDPEGFTMPHLD